MPDMEEENRLSHIIIGAAIKVRNTLGPGLPEKVYEECLFYLLQKEGLGLERQKSLPVIFEDVYLDAGFKLDLLVEDKVIIEIKSIERVLAVHEAQLYTYLKLSEKSLGLLMNFNVKLKKNGIKRMIMTSK